MMSIPVCIAVRAAAIGPQSMRRRILLDFRGQEDWRVVQLLYGDK